jgi:hypothetical protein
MVGLGVARAAAEDKQWVDAASMEAVRVEDGIEVHCTITNPLQQEMVKSLQLTVTDLDGNTVARGSKQFTLRTGRNACAVLVSGPIREDKIPLYVLKYELSGLMAAEKGARSLVHTLAQLETRLVAYRDFQAGSRATVRLVALNHATSLPAAGAYVVIKLAAGGVEHPLHEGKTGPDGGINAQFVVPEDIEGDTKLLIDVTAEGLGKDHIEQAVTVKRDIKILLTTDKPLYQPGQTIQMRALSLRAADLKPEANRELVFEVMDSKGNKVFKHKTNTEAFGVASAKFQLAIEVNLGGYTVRAVLGNATAEKQVTVDKYVLPKFKIEAKTERAYYLPGETLKAEVQADYFFGKPVAGGKVHVTASKFEVEFTKFTEADGALDPNGHWSFEIPLPAYFAGTPIEQGKASVRLEVAVTDTAEHREEKVVMTPVAGAALTIAGIPEGGALAPKLDNRVYLLVSYPDGSPAAGASVLAEGSGVVTSAGDLQTDDLGVATVTVKPENAGSFKLRVRAHDKQGHTAETAVDLSTKPLADGLILRADKTLYQVGDALRAEVYSTKAKGTVYFDLVRQGQTVMTRAAELQAGRAEITMDIDAAMSGSAALQAYVFTPGTDLIRDTRLLYVNPADALNLGVELDRDVHKPGEHAQLRFKVTDRAGTPAAAALGIAIVDESVFALQEIHPGLEKVYFTLEKEIMKPRYEIHGYALDQIVLAPVAEKGAAAARVAPWSDTQQEAARVLLASAPATPEPPVRVNTLDQKQNQADEEIFKVYQRDMQRVQRAVMRCLEKNSGKAPEDFLKTLVREKYLRPSDLVDPWGNNYEFDFTNIERGRGYFAMVSYGPDGIKGTADDLAPDSPWIQRLMVRGGVRGRQWGVVAELDMNGNLGAAAGRPAAPMAAPTRMMIMKREMAAEKADSLQTLSYAAKTGVPGQGPQPPRIREYFPETLLFEPALITDAQGAATLDVALADSITTWRMTAMASSGAGALGSKDAPLRVFQDFFADLDLPVAMTQHDRVSIPVVVYNYLDAAQDVRLKFEVEPWFKLDGNAEQTLPLSPKEVKSVYFPIEVVELGKHKLTAWAYGTSMSDAIRREIEVLPDGEEQNVTFSDRLSGRIEHTVTIPQTAIAGASKILVRVYPGVFSQIVDGLDSMLQMPSGCFEQTSSITYPNILIVQYMKATKQINPEIQMKAEGFINAGYQRLLSYEVQGGGFSWFGDAPANKVLTAWGLKEFFDMSRVHEVDPAVIDRTRAWLLSKQEKDGSWAPDQNYLHEESWGGIQKSTVLVTAYILDAVLGAGGAKGGNPPAIEYLKAHWKEGEPNAYTIALVANAAVAWNKDDPWTAEVLTKLYDLRQEDPTTAYWKGGAATVTFTHGDAADVETTALAAMAFIKAGKYPETTTKALTYLVRKKDAHGHWGSTQATILALKALMEALGNRTEKVNAKVTVTLNGEPVSDLAITPEDSDVMRLVDLGEKTKPGANTVALNLAGEGSMLYQVVGRHFVPWAMRKGPEEPMTIEVAYDKSELAVNDLVKVTVKVTNHRPAAAQMTIVDLGIPPGFQVAAPDLEALVQKKVLQKYELTGRQIITYFEKIAGNATVEFGYTLRAKFPLRAQTPESRVYEYYNPDVSGTAKPQALVVK